ncbi:MAG: hypothetical protein JXR67_00735 [Bacteroidales bacterium]|nr:hypothetical protein [Bacteroidales bacterium]
MFNSIGPIHIEFIFLGLILLEIALFLTMGWEPADNKEHKIINFPVPGCPMADQPTAELHTVPYYELLKE